GDTRARGGCSEVSVVSSLDIEGRGRGAHIFPCSRPLFPPPYRPRVPRKRARAPSSPPPQWPSAWTLRVSRDVIGCRARIPYRHTVLVCCTS
ncbi:hypothetical protein C8F04DRAFT_1003268, partial [Mycena alexandri]